MGLLYIILIYYKTWRYQCLIKQVKSPSICSRTPNSVPICQSGRAEIRGVTPAPDADEVDLERNARGFILALMGSFLFENKKGVHVHLCFLPLLRDLTQTSTYSWGGAVLAHTF